MVENTFSPLPCRRYSTPSPSKRGHKVFLEMISWSGSYASDNIVLSFGLSSYFYFVVIESITIQRYLVVYLDSILTQDRVELRVRLGRSVTVLEYDRAGD